MTDNIVIGGYYRHFKGRLYRVTAVARHTETLEAFVIYTDDAGHTWARPKTMFLGTTERGGETIPRFCLEKDKSDY